MSASEPDESPQKIRRIDANVRMLQLLNALLVAYEEAVRRDPLADSSKLQREVDGVIQAVGILGGNADDAERRMQAADAIVEQARVARDRADLLSEAKHYFAHNPTVLTGGKCYHEMMEKEVEVEFEDHPMRYHGHSGPFWKLYGRDFITNSLSVAYVGTNHPQLVAVSREPEARHERKYVETHNRLLIDYAYHPDSRLDIPVTLRRAQGTIAGWEDADAYLYGSGAEAEAARHRLFDTWRRNTTFLSTNASNESLRMRANVYIVYQVKAKCPLLSVGSGEFVLPPGVEMRALRVEIIRQESYIYRPPTYFYFIEAEVRADETYRPRPHPLPDK